MNDFPRTAALERPFVFEDLGQFWEGRDRQLQGLLVVIVG